MPFDNLKYGEPGEPSGNGNRSKFTIPGTWAGLLCTILLAGIFLIGLPEARWFLAISIPLGLIVAFIMRRMAPDR
jgi:hypothetical protein